MTLDDFNAAFRNQLTEPFSTMHVAAKYRG